MFLFAVSLRFLKVFRLLCFADAVCSDSDSLAISIPGN